MKPNILVQTFFLSIVSALIGYLCAKIDNSGRSPLGFYLVCLWVAIAAIFMLTFNLYS